MRNRLRVSRRLRIGYPVRYLPSPSETFVLDEALSLERKGAWTLPIVMDRVPGAVRHRRHEGLYKRADVMPRTSDPRAILAALLWEDLPSYAFVHAHWLQHGRQRDLRRVAWLARRIRRLQLDALRVHFAAETARFAVAAGLMAGVPVSVAVHGRDIFVPEPDLTWLLRNSALVTTITPWHRDRLLRLGLPSQLVELLPCAVAVPAEPALPPRPGGALRLLSVGRLVPKKGHDLLFRAAFELARRGQAVHVTVLGGGREEISLRRLAARLEEAQPERLRLELRGAVPVEEVDAELRTGRYHASALACRIADDGDRDGLPVSLLESLAHGVPVVTGGLPGFEHDLREDSGALLVPVHRAGARREVAVGELADTLASLVNQPHLRERLAEVAFETAQRRIGPDLAAERLLRWIGQACVTFRGPTEGSTEA